MAHVGAKIELPQIKIQVNRAWARVYGIQPGRLNEQLASLVGGWHLAELRDGQKTVDFTLRLPETFRDAPEKLSELLIETDSGRRVPLRLVADVRESSGPNVINRENGVRRVVVGANTTERDLQALVLRLQKEVQEKVKLPEGTYASFEGEFRAQQEAAKRITIFSILVFIVVARSRYSSGRSQETLSRRHRKREVAGIAILTSAGSGVSCLLPTRFPLLGF